MEKISGDYRENEKERILEFKHDGGYASISITKEGYGMLIVSDETGETERYYGFDMALDHVAEILGVRVNQLEVPEEAEDMGMRT